MRQSAQAQCCVSCAPCGDAPPPPVVDFLVTEAGDFLLTEAGDFFITEA